MLSMDMALYMKNRRASRREALIELAGGSCSICGSSDDIQFDHVDRRTKNFTLSGAALDKPWTTILAELEKCQLLCSACHEQKTRENRDLGGGHNKYDPVCGTAHCYSVMKCRCEKCREAKRLYRNKQIEFGQNIADYPI